MSVLGDLAAALLPPEAGGPPPERVASVSRRMIDAMPAPNRAGIGAALLAFEGLSVARWGRRIGRLEPERRAALLERVGGAGPVGAAALDGLKTIILMAAGADEYAASMYATGTALPPARPDPPLTLVDAGATVPAADVIVVGSGAGGAFCARDARARPASTYWSSRRVSAGIRGGSAARTRSRASPGIYRDGGSTIAVGAPPIALPIGRAVGGTTVVNSGTCYRPPAGRRRALARASMGWGRPCLATPMRRGSTMSRRRSASGPCRWR